MLDTNKLLNETKAHMQKRLSTLNMNWPKSPPTRANPAMLDGVYVDYYGTKHLWGQVSNDEYSRCKNNRDPAMGKINGGPIEKPFSSPTLDSSTERRYGSSHQRSCTHWRKKKRAGEKPKAEGNIVVVIRNIRRDANEHIKKESKSVLRMWWRIWKIAFRKWLTSLSP